jgi:hypothetical protein
MWKVSLGNILRDKERDIYKAIYEEIKENLVDINMQRQRILETRKKLNKRMRTLEKSAKNVNLEIVKLKRKYKEKI